MHQRLVFVLLLVAAILAACSSGGAGNRIPTAKFSASPTRGTVPLTVQFDASASSDADGDTLTYAWTFGDGESGSGAAVSHTYATAGTFTAKLTVSDGKGGNGSSEQAITVSDVTGGSGTINGLVTDSSTGSRLSGVSIEVAGQSVTTDPGGAFSVANLAAGEVILSFAKDGYAPGYADATVGDQATPVLVTLKKQGDLQSYQAGNSATIYQTTEAGPYAVIFEADSLSTSDSDLSVSVTPLDPTKEASALPGQLVTDDALLTPLTFAEFSIFDSQGRRVNLKAGASATVELPIPPQLRALPQYAQGKVIHCYSFNPASGQWEDFVVGTVTTSSVDGTTPVVRASIKHFSWYGAAPESTDCADVYGRVVSAVDGKPLPFARVEAFPGGVTTSDANGDFVLVAPRSGPNEFIATRTYTDTDGSVSGMPGAKVIEFGKVEDVPLTGLVSKACNSGASVLTTAVGEPADPLLINIGNIGRVTYNVDAFIFADTTNPALAGDALKAAGLLVPRNLTRLEPLASGTIYAFLYELLPDDQVGDGVAGAVVTLSGPNGSVTLQDGGGGVYYADADVRAGSSYTLAIDAEGNGSVDGTGSVFAVGNVSWLNPTDGATLAANGLTAKWADSAASTNPTYSALYFAWLFNEASDPNAVDGAYYIGTDRQFSPHSLYSEAENQPLKPGHYTGWVWGFSGPYSPGVGNADYTETNNITGVTVNGKFYSYSNSSGATVEFDLR